MSLDNIEGRRKLLSKVRTNISRLTCTVALTIPIVIASARSAAAEQDTTAPASGLQCVTANDAALDAMGQGRLLEARKYVAQCAHVNCPTLIREECAKLSSDWANSQPRLTFEIVGAWGERLSDVRVWVDGSPVDRSTPLEVDPGEHEGRFERAGYVAKKQVFDVKDRNPVLHVELVPDAVPKEVAVPQEAVQKTIIPKAVAPKAVTPQTATQKPGSPATPSPTGQSLNPTLDTDILSDEATTDTQEPDASPLTRLQVVGIIGVGVGALGLATGGVMLMSASGDHEKSLRNGCNANAQCTTPRGKELADAAREKANFATPFVLGGAALILGNAALFMLEAFGSERDDRAGELQVQPLLGLNGGGVNVAGHF